MNIETAFTRLKMVRDKYWEFLTKSYLTKIFKSRATNWYNASQNEASLHNNVPFELKNFIGLLCKSFDWFLHDIRFYWNIFLNRTQFLYNESHVNELFFNYLLNSIIDGFNSTLKRPVFDFVKKSLACNFVECLQRQ